MLTLEERQDAFLRYLRERGASPATVKSCLAALRLYFSLYEQTDAEHLLLFKSYLIGRYKPSTANARIYGMNRYLDCLEAEGSPAPLRLPALRLPARSFLDSVISQEDYLRLRDGLRRDENWFWYFAVRFLACTGARVGELVQMKAEHLALGYMDLYTKGGKLRRVYFPEPLCLEAREWAAARSLSSGFLFCARGNRPITPRGIRGQLKVLAERYKIPAETMYPHSFRHRFAKNFLDRFNDISLLADLMGHESIETTRVYLVRSQEEIRELIDRLVTW